MDWLPALLPSTVIIAIFLFVLKEGLEWNRRRRANNRQIRAFKTLLARECELNRWSMHGLSQALDEMVGQSADELSIDYEIERNQFGKVIFRNDNGSSWPLPEEHADFMRDNMFDVAALDETLFSLLESAYDSVVELAHLRQSFIQYLEIDRQHLEGFVGYGINRLKDIQLTLEELYLACTGEELGMGRVR
jgi:hypothetical protein